MAATAPLSAAQIAFVAIASGFPPTAVPRAVAHALCESSGQADATNDVGAGHTGLWQISGDHHERFNTNREQLKGPFKNGAVAAQLYRERGWQPWKASESCALGRMAEGRAAAADPKPWGSHDAGAGDLVGSAISDPTGALGAGWDAVAGSLRDIAGGVVNVGEAIVAGAGWLANRDNWGRIALVLLGAGVAIAGVATVLQPVTDRAIDTVGKVR